jgi:hypothetical protein
LLDVSMRLFDLPGLHGGKLLGHVLQRDHLAVPGLRGVERVRQSVEKVTGFRRGGRAFR